MSLLNSMMVLALVGGRSINDRDLHISRGLESVAVIENSLLTGFAAPTPRESEVALQKYITEILVFEESRVLGAQSVTGPVLESEMTKRKTVLGSKKWNQWLVSLDATEAEIRRRLEQKLIVEKIIEERVKVASQREKDPNLAMQEAQKSLKDWLDQLRSRYRVRRLAPPRFGDS
jgi:hypothetical protein